MPSKDPDTVTFIAHIPAETIARLRSAEIARQLAGTSWSMSDHFVKKMLDLIEEKTFEHTFAIKRDPY